ncbi:hypothetical protein FA13DRAFT_173510 [Coprinellus micaceus]|uniref:Hydrophobin n=1 Tax=Coprinellus micaceus TaxID=71717 RepID=A0A4Y7SH30_COPMI|nr:hypothetical protein FA13DRAFT_173510 [Coprinellus micaceus]
MPLLFRRRLLSVEVVGEAAQTHHPTHLHGFPQGQFGWTSATQGRSSAAGIIQEPSNPGIAPLLAVLGISTQGLSGYVGSNCSPISVIGLGSGTCVRQPLCCTNNNFNGIIALGCAPVLS